MTYIFQPSTSEGASKCHEIPAIHNLDARDRGAVDDFWRRAKARKIARSE